MGVRSRFAVHVARPTNHLQFVGLAELGRVAQRLGRLGQRIGLAELPALDLAVLITLPQRLRDLGTLLSARRRRLRRTGTARRMRRKRGLCRAPSGMDPPEAVLELSG
jgi:hypothetical protein